MKILLQPREQDSRKLSSQAAKNSIASLAEKSLNHTVVKIIEK